jgi:hypothetical protein
MRRAWWFLALLACAESETETDPADDSDVSFCEAGMEDCACFPGFGDAPGTCDEGLVCDDDEVCVPET